MLLDLQATEKNFVILSRGSSGFRAGSFSISVVSPGTQVISLSPHCHPLCWFQSIVKRWLRATLEAVCVLVLV